MTTLPDLFVQAGYPAFPLDEQGFPQMGPIIKYFRKQMVYTDLDGSERWWRQQDLADALGLKEDMIGLMETKNLTEDSISRRRALADALNIPPVLLGIGTLADLEAFLQACGTSQSHGNVSDRTINEHEMSLYKETLAIHWNMHYAGTLQDIQTLLYWSNRIELAASEHSASQQSLEELICGYDQLLARAYTDKRQYTDALKHLDSAHEIASVLRNKPLEAAVCYRYIYCRLDQRKFALAKAPADRALDLVRYADRSLQGQIYQGAGLTYALTALDEEDRKRAWKLLDLAGNIADEDDLGVDFHHARFNVGDYASGRADTLITLGQPTKALELLDEADERLPADQKIRRGYIQILQGEAYIKKKEFDTATTYLQDAFDASSVIRSDYNVGYIDRLCKQLGKSSYGTSPAVATLKRLVREYK